MPIYRLSATAEEDIIQLLAYTQDRFGEIARRRYEVLLVAGLRDIASDPERPGSVARPELGPAVRSYHLRHSRNRAGTPDARGNAARIGEPFAKASAALGYDVAEAFASGAWLDRCEGCRRGPRAAGRAGEWLSVALLNLVYREQLFPP